MSVKIEVLESLRLSVGQLMEFSIADHDDGPDALEMALWLAAGVLEGRAIKDGLGNRLPVGNTVITVRR